MDFFNALLESEEAETASEAKKKGKKKKISAKKLKKLLVKQQEEARIQLALAKQKYLEETKERVQWEWEKNKEKSKVYFEEQTRRIELLQLTFERIHEIENKWSEFINEKKNEHEWGRYMKCNRLPDARILPSVNTYKFVWTELENNASISYCLDKTEEVMQLLNGLDEAINDPWSDCPERVLNGWKSMRNELRNLLQNQINKSTYKLFRRIETDMHPIDVTTSEYYCNSKYFMMHLWAELITPIPCDRSVEGRQSLKLSFKPLELKIYVPSSLLNVHKVIRVMLMNYDHYSDRCRSSETPIPPIYHSKDFLQLTMAELDLRTEIVTYRENLEAIIKKKIGIIPPHPTVSQELYAWECEPQRVLSEEIAYREAENEELWKNDVRVKLSKHEINLREREFLGGVVALEVLQLPPQPKYLRFKFDVSLLREPQELKPVEYLVIYPPPRAVIEKNEEEEDEEVLEYEYNLLVVKTKKDLIDVSLKLPKTVYWFEVPEVAMWSEKNGYWSSEHVHDKNFDEEEEVLNFKIGALGLIGLHVSRFCNLPYKDWRLEADGSGGINFYLEAAKIALNFKIQKNEVCLEDIGNFPVKELPGLLRTFHSPYELLQMLKRFGIDVVPEVDAACYDSDFKPKHFVYERYLYQIWALFSTSFCFKFSKFNYDRGRNSVVFQVREVNNSFESNFCLVRASPTEACILDITEENESYSPRPSSDNEVSTDFYDLIMRHCTAEARRQANSATFLLVQTIRDLLGYIRPLSFS